MIIFIGCVPKFKADTKNNEILGSGSQSPKDSTEE